MLRLLRLGLSWDDCRRLSLDEVLCLLVHADLADQLEHLDQESARVAGLSLADPNEVERALIALRHQAQAALSRFYR